MPRTGPRMGLTHADPVRLRAPTHSPIPLPMRTEGTTPSDRARTNAVGVRALGTTGISTLDQTYSPMTAMRS